MSDVPASPTPAQPTKADPPTTRDVATTPAAQVDEFDFFTTPEPSAPAAPTPSAAGGSPVVWENEGAVVF